MTPMMGLFLRCLVALAMLLLMVSMVDAAFAAPVDTPSANTV